MTIKPPLHRALRLAWGWALLLAASPLVRAAEVPGVPMLRIEAGMHTAAIRRIDADAAGRYAVTASDDKTARVWNVASGQLLRVLRPPVGDGNEGKLHAVALSPDGSTIATAGWTGLDWNRQAHVYLFDRASGRLLRRLGALPEVVQHLAFSRDGRWLAATLAGTGGVRVWDWRTPAAPLADTDYGDDSYGAGWSRDGRLVVSSFDGRLRLYRIEGAAGSARLKKLADAVAPGGKEPASLAFHPDDRSLAVGYADTARVDVLDTTRLALLHSPSTQGVDNGNLSRVAWSSDGRQLAAAGRWNINGTRIVRLWPDAGRGQPQDVPANGNTVMQLLPLAAGGWLVGAFDPAWGVVSADARWSLRGSAPVADLRGSRDKAFPLAAGALQLQFGFDDGGKSPHTFDLSRRELRAAPLNGGQAADVASLPVQQWANRTDPVLRGQPIQLQPHERSRSLAIAPGGASFALGTDRTLRHLNGDGSPRWEVPVPGPVWGVNIPKDGARAGKLVVAAYGDGTIRWHRLSDGQELLAFFPHADRKRWVLWTPSGYYDASPGAEELIGWHVNRGQDAAADFFPASRFRSRFFRPDVIDRVLDTLDEGQALAQADAARGQRQQAPVSVAQVLPPVVELLSGAELRTSAPQVTLRLRARSASDAPVTSWRVRVDGQAVADMRGLQRSDANMSERELSVPVPAQDSEIQVFAENRHGTSTPAVVRVAWAGAAPAKPAGFQIQPKLYVLAVGVGAYQHAGVNRLSFPAKDARDFTQALQRQKGRLYRDVEVKLLTDTDATADAVVDGLDWLKRQVTQHDLGMVFVAGHGTNDADLGYTFLPVNADPERLRRTGVPMAEFKLTLSRLAGKALFFFDTCHSGNVLGGAPGLQSRAGPSDLNGVINDFASAENGVVVFSSSTGRQLSYEHTAWGNGAFTKALVEGLDGRADFQKNGRITHKMLDLYVSERVKALTEGRQSPVTQAPGGVPDFPVAIAKP